MAVASLEWESIFNNCFQLAQNTLKSINERISGLKAGVARQSFVAQHTRNIKNSKTIEETTQQLGASLNGLVQSKIISMQEMQVRDQKLQKIIKLNGEIKSKLSLSEDDIMNQSRDELLRGGKVRERGETEETRALSNEEMLQSFDVVIEQQDVLLDELHAGIVREKERAKDIDSELDAQDKLIDSVSNKATSSTKRTNFMSRKVLHVEKKSRACCLYIVIVVLVALLIVMLATGNFGMGFGTGKSKGGDSGGDDNTDTPEDDEDSNDDDWECSKGSCMEQVGDDGDGYGDDNDDGMGFGSKWLSKIWRKVV